MSRNTNRLEPTRREPRDATHVVERIALALNEHSKSIKCSRICILGVAYKKDVDDARESPAFEIMELLKSRGAYVSYNDPYFPIVSKGRKYDLQMQCASLKDLGDYDCVVIITDHSNYDYERIVRESRLVVDTRNATRDIQSSKIVRC